jgi:hypothetical protein
VRCAVSSDTISRASSVSSSRTTHTLTTARKRSARADSTGGARLFSSAENILERHTRESEATVAAARPAHRCAPRGAREQHTLLRPRASALHEPARPARTTFSLPRKTFWRDTPARARQRSLLLAPRTGVRRVARENNTRSYDRAQALRTSRLDPRARLFSSAENILERHTRESQATVAAVRPAHRCCTHCAFVRSYVLFELNLRRLARGGSAC